VLKHLKVESRWLLTHASNVTFQCGEDVTRLVPTATPSTIRYDPAESRVRLQMAVTTICPETVAPAGDRIAKLLEVGVEPEFTTSETVAVWVV
jgi:hypothetical protein